MKHETEININLLNELLIPLDYEEQELFAHQLLRVNFPKIENDNTN